MKLQILTIILFSMALSANAQTSARGGATGGKIQIPSKPGVVIGAFNFSYDKSGKQNPRG